MPGTLLGIKYDAISESRGELKYGPRQVCCVCLKTVTRFESQTRYWRDGHVQRFHACPEHADRI